MKVEVRLKEFLAVHLCKCGREIQFTKEDTETVTCPLCRRVYEISIRIKEVK